MAGHKITQVTVKLNPEDEVSCKFFSYIENRNREIYPTIFSYLNAAVETLEIASDGGNSYPLLTETDLDLIGLTVLEALREYEAKKTEEQMAP